MKQSLNTIARMIRNADKRFIEADDAIGRHLERASEQFASKEIFVDWLEQEDLLDNVRRKILRESDWSGTIK